MKKVNILSILIILLIFCLIAYWVLPPSFEASNPRAEAYFFIITITNKGLKSVEGVVIIGTDHKLDGEYLASVFPHDFYVSPFGKVDVHVKMNGKVVEGIGYLVTISVIGTELYQKWFVP